MVKQCQCISWLKNANVYEKVQISHDSQNFKRNEPNYNWPFLHDCYNDKDGTKLPTFSFKRFIYKALIYLKN